MNCSEKVTAAIEKSPKFRRKFIKSAYEEMAFRFWYSQKQLNGEVIDSSFSYNNFVSMKRTDGIVFQAKRILG